MRWARACLLTPLPIAGEGGYPTMPTLRHERAPLLSVAFLAFFLPACSAPPVASAGPDPCREGAAPFNPSTPEGPRQVVAPDSAEATHSTNSQPRASEVGGGDRGSEADPGPWQARHGGSCCQRGDFWATLR